MAQITEDVKTICDLERVGCALPRALSVGPCAVSTDDFDLGMRRKPSRQCIGLSIWQEIHRSMALQIHKHRSIAMPPAPRPVIDAEHLDSLARLRAIALLQHSKNCIGANHCRTSFFTGKKTS
jgi:hypothetical protein